MAWVRPAREPGYSITEGDEGCKHLIVPAEKCTTCFPTAVEEQFSFNLVDE